ncbi:N-glycosylase/DNA lyase [Emiliania huxleyi CCMP1516]|uniref:DNA-(apurinic or apyrimidinic site) lyase n=2 Tax=Emiliania huxleyi TaxID=2903 RepID=A0A0D3K8B1_EMIH1|nr:N-glycosylase/DNA lyase [Emiliania huxleyi CCMP1516]EOD31996.1 N-glycosylase/DNA lyase [Emiliania huxleyi CCMP1516]|eukprot:XP_005784425.1 N-glycosylase/DNA lyase [Emiliania huxleyi CCMP1516]
MAAADAFSPWSDLCVPPDALRLAPTLLSGMSFRWHPSAAGNIYVGVLSDCIYELREDDATVHWRVCGPADSDRARAQLREHLSLDRGVTASAWAGGGQLPVQFFHAAAALPGVRVVSVLSRLESLVSFMGSANNNIKRNMQMVASLCANFEENRLGCDSEGAALFSFPSVAQLCSLSEERLWELGWGYRAPRLHKLSRQLEERGGEAWLDSLARLCDEELRAELVALCGVGRKAAARCSSAAPRSPVPVDTHCLQMARRFLLPPAARDKSFGPALYEQISACFVDLFGPLAGWAFMTLFAGELADFRRRAAACRVETRAARRRRSGCEAEAQSAEADRAVEASSPSGKRASRYF